MDRVDAVCPHLCRRHHSITSPAEVWELLPVEAEANWSGIRRDPVLDLELELVEGGKVEVWSWPGKAEDRQLQRRMLGNPTFPPVRRLTRCTDVQPRCPDTGTVPMSRHRTCPQRHLCHTDSLGQWKHLKGSISDCFHFCIGKLPK